MEKFIEDKLMHSERLLKALAIAKVCNEPEIEHLMSTLKSHLNKCMMLLEKRNNLVLEKKKLLEDISVIQTECDALAEEVQGTYEYFIDLLPNLSDQSIDSNNQVQEKENRSTLNNGLEVSPCPSEWDKNPLFTPLQPRGYFMNDSTYNMVEDVPKPYIALIDSEQMSSVPAYMKGRLTCDSVNSFIETLNSVLKKKYSIVNLARRDVKRKDLVQYSKWKSQEEEYGLKGKTYFTAEDLMTLGNTKLDKMADKIIQVLRHIKRLRQSQVCGKLVLYILLQSDFDTVNF